MKSQNKSLWYSWVCAIISSIIDSDKSKFSTPQDYELKAKKFKLTTLDIAVAKKGVVMKINNSKNQEIIT